MDPPHALTLLILVKLRKSLTSSLHINIFSSYSFPGQNVSCYRYSMVLADNVDGGDDLDLIVSTMNGNVFCFSTPSPHHPLKARPTPMTVLSGLYSTCSCFFFNVGDY